MVSILDIAFAIQLQLATKDNKVSNRDYDYWNELKLKLKRIRLKYKQECESYCKISTQQYDKRYNLAPKRDKDCNLVKPNHKFGFQPLKQFIKGAKGLHTFVSLNEIGKKGYFKKNK